MQRSNWFFQSKIGYFKHWNISFSLKQKKACFVMDSSSSSVSGKVGICLLRNDLRVHDNEALFSANQNCCQVLPLYCFDPRHFGGTYHYGFPKTGSHRLKFLLECVTDLRQTLQSHGSDLVIRCGKPEEVIPQLIESLNLRTEETVIYLHKEVTDEEVKVEQSIKEATKASVHTVWGHTLYHVEDLPFRPKDLSDVYTQFRKQVEGNTPVRRCIPMPVKLKPIPSGINPGELPSFKDLGVSAPLKDTRSAFPFCGGETSALERLHSYLWSTDNVSSYKETRNGMIGADYSTKFSSWLAHGCISPRKIYWEIKKYEKERVSNQSTYWVIFELIWRDYFRFVGLKFGNQLFFPGGLKGEHKSWKDNKVHFKAWQEGRTGVPYIDANMREMAATGFMSNRGRQNVASFLTKDLQLDWRLGAEWFESLLIDHDVCSNYGNWLYSAGLGNDPRENRKFNVVKQGLDYDADGKYIRIWLPELDGIQTGKVHCPWTLSPAALQAGGINLGETYPKPVVIAPEWSRHTSRPGSSSSWHEGKNQQAGSARGRDQATRSHKGRGQPFRGAGQKRGLDFYFSNSNPR